MANSAAVVMLAAWSTFTQLPFLISFYTWIMSSDGVTATKIARPIKMYASHEHTFQMTCFFSFCFWSQRAISSMRFRVLALRVVRIY